MGAHGAAELAHPNLLARALHTRPSAAQLIQPPGEHEAQRERLGMHAVGPAHHQRVSLGGGPAPNRLVQSGQVTEQDVGGPGQLDGEGRVEYIRGGEPPMQVARVIAQGLRHRAQESQQVMSHAGLEGVDPGRVHGGPAQARNGVGGHLPQLGPSLGCQQLDFEPQQELCFRLEDRAHLGMSVPRNQTAASLLSGGGRREWRHYTGPTGPTPISIFGRPDRSWAGAPCPSQRPRLVPAGTLAERNH